MITKVVRPCLEDFTLALLVLANPAKHVILVTIATGRPNQVNNATEEPECRFRTAHQTIILQFIVIIVKM